MMKKSGKLRERDLAHLWHPFTQTNSLASAPFPVMKRAEGVFLYDTDGKHYYDGISSWWCVNLGHSHPRLVRAVREQTGVLDQSILGGMTHENAVRLAEKIAQITPPGLEYSLFASDGACATEAALKISLQYFSNTGRPHRKRFVSLEEGYHGDTLGAVSVGYVDRFHKVFASVFTPSLRARSPHCFHCPCGKEPESCKTECFASMEDIVRRNHESIAACIVEPVCQGAAGMRIYPKRYLQKLRKLTKEHNILLIADEIAVGFGRTGRLFASSFAGIQPDIMCLGKALTGGMLPLSAAVVTKEIYDAFRNTGDSDRTFYHGHTTCGSPVTMNVALEACRVYEDEQVLENASGAMQALKKGFQAFSEIDCVHKTDTLGMMSSLEIREEAGGAACAGEIALKAAERGLFIRPLGNILYLWPPLTTTEHQMQEMLSIMEEALHC